jgi:AGZA family xanthine/uracil permease-like MFS transporter
MIKNIFDLKNRGTNLGREILGGITTFMTMSYIIFVQPVVLSACGMDKGAVFVATIISSSLAMIVMALLANYPIALAPAMGHNFYFAYTICLSMGISWQVALGANFIAGLIFILLSFFGLRERLINSVPESLKNAIAVGIGLLIALIGLEWAGIVVGHKTTLINIGNLKNPYTLLSLSGLIIISLFLVRKIKGAILWGILITTFLANIFGMVKFESFLDKPPSIFPTFLKLNILGALKWELIGVIFTLFFLDLFDTVGTLIGLGEEAGFIKEGKFPRAREALLSDAIGTVSGTLLGTSTITSYIESSTGIAEGARTGLANIITAFLFLLSIFSYPLIRIISFEVKINGQVLYPVIAPALIVVGCFILKNIKKICWEDFSECIPAFLVIIMIPLTFSITEGISFGFISYSFLKIIKGKYKEVPFLIFIFSFLFILRYIFLK